MAWVFNVPWEADFIPTTIVWVREENIPYVSASANFISCSEKPVPHVTGWLLLSGGLKNETEETVHFHIFGTPSVHIPLLSVNCYLTAFI